MLPRQMHLPLARPRKYLHNRSDRFYPKVWPQVPQSHLKTYRLLCCVYALKGPCFGDLWHVHLKLKIRWSVVSENAATLVCWEAPQMLFGLRNVELFFFLHLSKWAFWESRAQTYAFLTGPTTACMQRLLMRKALIASALFFFAPSFIPMPDPAENKLFLFG